MDTDIDSLSANLPDRQFRWHPLLQQWVIISAATSNRPWSGAVTAAETTDIPQHDASCYLCPGVTRSSGIVNPDYQGPFAFDNDFPSLTGDSWAEPDASSEDPFNELQLSMPSAGKCRVLCWSQRHDHTISDLTPAQVQQVAELWQAEHKHLSGLNHVAQVVMFENKGMETGTSNLHPHGQIYALPFVSDNAERMRKAQSEFYQKHHSGNQGSSTSDGQGGSANSLLPHLVSRSEYQASHPHSLLIEEGRYFKTIVPYFARFAYESWIVPKQPVADFGAMTPQQLSELGRLYQMQCRRYDRLFARKSPNITLFHNAPCDAHKDNRHCCFFLAMQPPLRAPDMLKYLAGFESSAGNIVNPVVPEIAAHRLRASSSASDSETSNQNGRG